MLLILSMWDSFQKVVFFLIVLIDFCTGINCKSTLPCHIYRRLQVHVQHTHSQESALCDGCGKVYKSIYKLQEHELSCGKMEKPFKCTVCDYATTSITNLNSEYRVTTGLEISVRPTRPTLVKIRQDQ